MDRQQLIFAIAGTLLAVFVLGWLAGWLVGRLAQGRGGGSQDGEMADRIGRRLDDAEAARAAAVAELATRQLDLEQAMAHLAEAQVEIEELRAYIEKRLTGTGRQSE